MRTWILVPFQFGPHPVQPPLFADRMNFSLATGSSVHSVIPPRPPLSNDDLMTFHRIREAQLVLEVSRAAFATEYPDGLLDSLEIHFVKGHCTCHWYPGWKNPETPLVRSQPEPDRALRPHIPGQRT